MACCFSLEANSEEIALKMLCMIGSLDFLVLKGPTCSNLYPTIHPYQSEELVQKLEQILISLLPFFSSFLLTHH